MCARTCVAKVSRGSRREIPRGKPRGMRICFAALRLSSRLLRYHEAILRKRIGICKGTKAFVTWHVGCMNLKLHLPVDAIDARRLARCARANELGTIQRKIRPGRLSCSNYRSVPSGVPVRAGLHVSGKWEISEQYL